MEGLTRLVTESLVRHGFDRPLDYRRLKWSRWFRCESAHSLLFVPSQPGVFALAEEIMNVAATNVHVGTAASAIQRTLSEAKGIAPEAGSSKPEADPARRMLAVSQVFEADDMAFILDRMLSYQNPMRARLASGRYFVRFVVIEDQAQRRSIASALNQWIASSTEKATGIGSHFASSLELTPANEQTHVGAAASAVQRTLSEAKGSGSAIARSDTRSSPTAPQPDSGAATNINSPSPFPAGF